VGVEDPGLTAELEEARVPFLGEVTSTWLPTILSWVVPVALFFLLWSYLLKKVGPGNGLMQIGKSKAKVYIEKKLESRLPTLRKLTRLRRNSSRWSGS